MDIVSQETLLFFLGIVNFWLVLFAVVAIVSILRYVRITRLTYTPQPIAVLSKRSTQEIPSAKRSTLTTARISSLEDDSPSFAIRINPELIKKNSEAESIIKNRTRSA